MHKLLSGGQTDVVDADLSKYSGGAEFNRRIVVVGLVGIRNWPWRVLKSGVDHGIFRNTVLVLEERLESFSEHNKRRTHPGETRFYKTGSN